MLCDDHVMKRLRYGTHTLCDAMFCDVYELRYYVFQLHPLELLIICTYSTCTSYWDKYVALNFSFKKYKHDD